MIQTNDMILILIALVFTGIGVFAFVKAKQRMLMSVAFLMAIITLLHMWQNHQGDPLPTMIVILALYGSFFLILWLLYQQPCTKLVANCMLHENLLSILTDIVIVLDAKQRIVDISKAGKTLLG